MKKINYKSPLALVIVALLLFACNGESLEAKDNDEQETSIELKSSYNLLNYTPNIYHDYFKRADHSAGFSSLKANSLAEHSIVQRVNIKNDLKKQSLSINSITISELSKSSKISTSNSKSIYGKTISFKISSINALARNEKGTNTEVTMYVPDLVEITNPKITNKDELFPSCYSEDFVLEWNADPNNKEGLAVIAEYFGNNAVPQNSTNEHILNTDFIEIDNGRTVLNNDIFKDIPNLSIVHLILLRGNVTIEEIEGEFYKFFAESHVRLPIILVKDLNTVAK